VSNLEPGKKYSYRLGDASRGWWSETGTLQTADGTDKTAFIALADMQGQNDTQYGVFSDVLKAAFTTVPDAKFVVSAGSQVTLAKNCKHWKSFFNTAADSLIKTFFMPAAGAREKAGGYLTKYFVLKGIPKQKTDTGVYYSYDYNNIHFTVLNTNNLAGKELGEPQLNWLKEDVSSSDADWKVVVLPKAIYSNGAKATAKENKNIRAQLSGLLPYLGVDLVLQGQDLVYWRTGALSGGLPAMSGKEKVSYNGSDYTAMVNPQGTVYALPGTAGVKRVYETNNTATLFPNAEKSFVPDAPMFASIRTDGSTLYYDAYKVIDGKAEKADSFAIKKTGSSGAGSFFNLLASKMDFSFLWSIIGFFVNIFSVFAK
ncbi:MAG: metallophosphoesterase family protein, partial [Clostridia bacterium]|nr:metallophosphoesterase family protein [Clostridia bacterium]